MQALAGSIYTHKRPIARNDAAQEARRQRLQFPPLAAAACAPALPTSGCNALPDWPRCCPSGAGIGSVGIFLEDREKPAVNIFKQVGRRACLGGGLAHAP